MVSARPIQFETITPNRARYHWWPSAREQAQAPAAIQATYAVACALGFNNVPPALEAPIPYKTIEQRCSVRSGVDVTCGAVLDRLRKDSHGNVQGTATPWPNGTRAYGQEPHKRMQRWMKRLSKGAAQEPEKYPRYDDMVAMIVLDYVTGNWGRLETRTWHGLPDQNRIFAWGYARAFPEQLGSEDHQQLLDRLHHVQQFPEHFVTRLRELPLGPLERAIQNTFPPDPANEARLNGWSERLATLRSYVGMWTTQL